MSIGRNTGWTRHLPTGRRRVRAAAAVCAFLLLANLPDARLPHWGHERYDWQLPHLGVICLSDPMNATPLWFFWQPCGSALRCIGDMSRADLAAAHRLVALPRLLRDPPNGLEYLFLKGEGVSLTQQDREYTLGIPMCANMRR